MGRPVALLAVARSQTTRANLNEKLPVAVVAPQKAKTASQRRGILQPRHPEKAITLNHEGWPRPRRCRLARRRSHPRNARNRDPSQASDPRADRCPLFQSRISIHPCNLEPNSRRLPARDDCFGAPSSRDCGAWRGKRNAPARFEALITHFLTTQILR